MRHVTRSWQATVLSGSAEYRGAKHTVVDRWLRVSAQKVSLASVDLPDRSHAAVTTRSSTAAPVTSRVDHRGPTWPSASRFRPGTAWSGWASRDRQRTMHMDTSPVHSLAVHELRQPPPRRTHRRGWPRTDWMTPEVWADARWNALSRTIVWRKLK